MKTIQISTSPENHILKQLYSLNQDHAHYLTNLSSESDLSKLIELSDICMYLLSDDEVVGFMMCFREKSEHRSVNYKFFNDRESRFIYVDRIAIKEDHSRKGLGSNLYKELYELSSLKQLPICCEVYTVPLNQISLNFHYKNGFKSVGEYKFENNSVEYLTRPFI
ncbi:MAG: GNAT family N-acetyltransferase [Proteobacteria bacterium]|nr:GNAT family N-acetyltransferase [Pseudomonadota bacterium]